jgi:hypothetical protein
MSQHKLGAPPGPEKESGSLGLNPGLHREKNISIRTLPNSELVVNADRELINRLGGVSLFKVSCGRLTRYEVAHGFSRWSFNLLFPAIGKFERLTKGGVS